MSERQKRSEPDYQAWQDGIKNLPDRRFIFVVTMLTMVLVIYLVRDSIWAVSVVSFLMLAFGTIVFLLQKRSDDDQTPKDGSAKSSDQPSPTNETSRVDGDVRFSLDDRNGSPCPSGLRTSMGSKKE